MKILMIVVLVIQSCCCETLCGREKPLSLQSEGQSNQDVLNLFGDEGEGEREPDQCKVLSDQLKDILLGNE